MSAEHPLVRATRVATEAEEAFLSADAAAEGAAAARRLAFYYFERAEVEVRERAEADRDAEWECRSVGSYNDPEARRGSLRAKEQRAAARHALMAAQERREEARAELCRMEDAFERSRQARQHARSRMEAAERVLYGGLG